MRGPAPLIPFTWVATDAEVGCAEGGRFAEREGDEVAEDVPLMPFMEVWLFSGRFDLLIL